MWIVCCGMKRSGSTLQYQLAAHLVEGAGLGARVGWTEKFADAVALTAGTRAWKVYKNHNYSEEIAAQFRAGQAKGIYVYRDVRDVFVSFMHKQDAPFERLWQRDILHELVENDAKWTALPDMLVSRYEEMSQDIAAEVGRIAAHLGIPVSHDEAGAIAGEYNVELQKARTDQFKDPKSLSSKITFDPHSLLHDNHISKTQGQVGQWRDYLSQAQVDLIETRYGDWLTSHGYALSNESVSGT